jgi:two-component system, NtrC family, sensor histidine kinase KinB
MLRTRLLLTLALFGGVLVATGIYAIALFSRLANGVEVAVVENYRSILATREISLALAGMEREAWGASGKPGPAGLAFTEYQRSFQTNLALQLQARSLRGEPELNLQLAAHAKAFREATRRLFSAPTPEGRHQVYEERFLPELLTLNALAEKVSDLNQRAILAASQTVRRATGGVTRLMLAGLALALLISAYAGLTFSRAVLQPIQSLTRAARELGEGQPGQPVPVAGRDELGELARAFNHMAAQLEAYRHSTAEKIVRLHRTMESTIASFPDAIFVLNHQGQLELKNPAAAELASAMQLNDQLPAPLQAKTRKTLESGENFLPHSFDEALFYRLGGQGKFFLPRVLAMRDREEKIFGVAVVLYDITRFRLLDAAKTNLVGTVSHELKTPLTSVRMALHLALERTLGSLTPKQEELLEVARQDTERLLRILNDLLDLTRLEEGAAELRREAVLPALLLQDAVAEVAEQLSAHSLKLDCSVAENLPPVLVDPPQIRYVFVNLLTNAVKHSPAQGKIQLRAEPAGDHSVLFSVTDQGPGVPDEYQGRIFERFFRVPGQTRTGVGLGLSIAREITVAHGGRIGVKSAPGRGSTFYVALKTNGLANPSPVQSGLAEGGVDGDVTL